MITPSGCGNARHPSAVLPVVPRKQRQLERRDDGDLGGPPAQVTHIVQAIADLEAGADGLHEIGVESTPDLPPPQVRDDRALHLLCREEAGL